MIMKIWMQDTQNSSHRLVRLNAEEHSDYHYDGEFYDEDLKAFLITLQADMDVEKNSKLLAYYGYLHLFIINKS